MSWLLIVIVVLVVLVLLWAVLLYNGLVKKRNRVDNAWAQVEVQLKRRHDLIPNLVESVKGYAAHERGTFDPSRRHAPRRRPRRARLRPGRPRASSARRSEGSSPWPRPTRS